MTYASMGKGPPFWNSVHKFFCSNKKPCVRFHQQMTDRPLPSEFLRDFELVFQTCQLKKKVTMATFVSCAVVAVFGIEDSQFGCSCEHHPICGVNVDYDTLLRFKTVVIPSGKPHEWKQFFLIISTHPVFEFTGRHQNTTILAAIWVTDGMDRCIVGYVDPRALVVRMHLEGRLGQVTDIFSLSSSATKNRYSMAHKGVCLASLIDNYLPGDDLINSCLDAVESDESEEED